MRRYLLSFILCFILVFSVFTLFFQGMEVKAQPAGPAGGGGGPPAGPPAGEEEGEVITSEHVSTKVFLIPSNFSVRLGETITVSCWVEDSEGNRLTNGAVAIFATGGSLSKTVFNLADFPDGLFTFEWTAPVSDGEYTITAYFSGFRSGNTDYVSSTSSTTIRVSSYLIVENFSVTPKNITLGGNITISFYVFYFDGSPLKEGSALINIKDSQGLSIATLTVTPNEQGVFNSSFTTTTAGTFEVEIPVGGVSDFAGTTNIFEYNKTFNVLAFTTLSLASASPTVDFGQPIHLIGNLTPPIANAQIKVYERIEGEEWTFVGSVLSNLDGFFTFDYVPVESGYHDFKVLWEGSDYYAGNESNVVQVFVKFNSSISCRVVPYFPTVNETCVVQGVLSPPLKDETITVFVERDGVTVEFETLTNQNGFYEVTWTPTQLGNYSIWSVWSGNLDYSTASSGVVNIWVAENKVNLTCFVTPSKVEYLSKVFIHGEVNPPIPSQTVYLELTAPNGSTIKDSASFNQEGSYGFNVTVADTGNWTVTVYCLGNQTYGGNVATANFTVVKANSIITCIVPEEIRILTPTEFSGNILPPRGNVEVTLTLTSPDGEIYNVTTITFEDGSFVFNVTLDKLGNWLAFTSWEGDNCLYGSVSQPVNFTAVKALSVVKVFCPFAVDGPEGWFGGFTVSISPQPKKANMTVWVEKDGVKAYFLRDIEVEKGFVWFSISQPFGLLPPSPLTVYSPYGLYRVYCSWTGSNSSEGATGKASIIVYRVFTFVELPEYNYIDCYSNSSRINVDFDFSTKTFDVQVEGPPNTHGVTVLAVDKHVMEFLGLDVSDFSVKVNGVKTGFEIENRGWYTLLIVVYSHGE